MHILIIDDDEESCDLLETFFINEGFVVHYTLAGPGGLQLVSQLKPDLVILDVRMPEMDGREVCQRIRAFSDVPILMISAFAIQVGEMVQGLNCGADDYLAKPLDFDLLIAKVAALLRRSGMVNWQQGHPVYVDPYLMVDLRHQRVCVQGQVVSMSPLEYRLLGLLLYNINRTVPAIDIMEHLWPGRAGESTDSLRTHIKRLREIIELEPNNPRYILTEHGIGYRFVTQNDVHESFTKAR